jgi:hypothetical protein
MIYYRKTLFGCGPKLTAVHYYAIFLWSRFLCLVLLLIAILFLPTLKEVIYETLSFHYFKMIYDRRNHMWDSPLRLDLQKWSFFVRIRKMVSSETGNSL